MKYDWWNNWPGDFCLIAVSEGAGLAQRPQYSGIVNAFSSIVQKQGFQGLYQGVTPNVMGTGISWGVYFLR